MEPSWRPCCGSPVFLLVLSDERVISRVHSLLRVHRVCQRGSRVASDACGLGVPRAKWGVSVQIVSGGVTNVGRVRTNNEDCFRIVAPLHLFVLSDGMGGEAHGEIASALAVETVVQHSVHGQKNAAVTLYGEQQLDWSDKTKRLSSAAHPPNTKIFSPP